MVVLMGVDADLEKKYFFNVRTLAGIRTTVVRTSAWLGSVLMVGDVGQQMIGIVLFVWTRVKKLVEAHVHTFANDCFEKAYYFCTLFERFNFLYSRNNSNSNAFNMKMFKILKLTL